MLVLLKAMLGFGLALQLGWKRWAATAAAIFYGILWNYSSRGAVERNAEARPYADRSA